MTFYFAPAGTLPNDLAAWTNVGDVISDDGFAFKESGEAIAEHSRQVNLTFDMEFTLMMSRRESRRAITAVQRMLRRPAFIHNGRKPR